MKVPRIGLLKVEILAPYAERHNLFWCGCDRTGHRRHNRGWNAVFVLWLGMTQSAFIVCYFLREQETEAA